jgi:protein SCO1
MIRLLAAMACGLVVLIGCGRKESVPVEVRVTTNAAPPTTYQVTGVVKRVEPDKKRIVIRHDEITNYMAAMTMPFDVKDTNQLSVAKPGDGVTFRLLVTEDDGWIDSVTVVSNAAVITSATNQPEPVRFVSSVGELKVGDLVPDYAFTNQLGREIRLRDFRGGALALTFVFTRCPYPDFCPRMSDHFGKTMRRLKAMPGAPTNFHLLSISFDPEWDTPRRLEDYGKRFGQDPEKWTLATGAWDPIERLGGHFGLIFGRNVPADRLEHNLRTVVLRPDGTVHAILISNEWQVDELVGAMVDAAKIR